MARSKVKSRSHHDVAHLHPLTNIPTKYQLSTPYYGLDVLNITMHTEVVIHSMNAYVWCWSKICGSLDEIPSLTMVSYKSKILNKF